MNPMIGRLSYKFLSQDDAELSCVKNEKVVILEDCGDGWSFCHRFLDPSAQGYVPTAYLKVLENEKLPSDIMYERQTNETADSYSPRESTVPISLNKKQSETMNVINVSFRKYLLFLKFRRYYSMSHKFKKQRNRLLQIQETISTEETYVRHLTFCMENVKRPLLEQMIISDQQSKALFSNVNDIKRLSNMFLSDLRSMLERMPRLRIASCFSRVLPFFRIYRQYINNFETSNEVYEQIKRSNPRFKIFDDSLNQQPGSDQMTMKDFFLIPVMRIPRYRLLLGHILKYTDENHEEYEELKRVLSQVCDYTDQIQTGHNYSSSRPTGVIELAKALRGRYDNLIQPHRKYIDQVRVKLKKSKDAKEKKLINRFTSFKCYLFSDLVIFLESKNLLLIRAPRAGIYSLESTEVCKWKNNQVCMKTLDEEDGKVVHFYVLFSGFSGNERRDKWLCLFEKYIGECVRRKKEKNLSHGDTENEKDVLERVEYLVHKHLLLVDDDDNDTYCKSKYVIRIKFDDLVTLYCYKFFLV